MMIQKKKLSLWRLRIICLFSGAIAGFVCGLFLPAVFQNTSTPGITAAVMGGAGIFSFLLLSVWRRFPWLSAVVLISGALGCRTLLPAFAGVPAADGLLLGVVLAAIRAGNRMDRYGFAAAFLLAAILGGLYLWCPDAGFLFLYPGIFLAGAVRFPRKRGGRFLMLALVVPVFIISMTVPLRLPPSAPPLLPLAGLSAACLPDEVQPDLLRIGKPQSEIGALWQELPFAGERWTCRTGACREKTLKGPPGTALLRTPKEFDLIFAEELPPGDQQRFCEVLWQKLDPQNGVLVLPAERRELLPKLKWYPLPGSQSRCAVSFRGHVPELEPEALDSALVRKLADAGADGFIPGGVLSGLLMTPEAPLPELPPPQASGTRNFWIAAAVYLVLAAFSARKERREILLAAAGNGCALLLILSAVFQHCRSLVLFSGISPNFAFAAFALVFAGVPFGPVMRRALGGLGIAAVCWWFMHPVLVLPALAAAVLCSFFTAIEHETLCRMKVLPRKKLDIALLFGAALGGVLFCLLAPQAGSSLFGCALLAVLMRLTALFRR